VAAAAPFVLVHGTLVGPSTWSPVADELRSRGHDVIVPHLTDAGRDEGCFWRRHASCVAEAAGEGDPVVVAGHSATGAILPAVVEALARPVVAVIFVDAQLPPPDGSSRAEVASERLRERLVDVLASDGTYPHWTDDDWQDDLPEPETRTLVFAELQPKPRRYFEEPLHVPADWERLPGAYLLLSDAYAGAAERAQALGWPFRELGGGHFAIMRQPEAVAGALVDLSRAAAAA